jgi:hypothetical protein
MNSFLMHLQSATQYERIENVVSFVKKYDLTIVYMTGRRMRSNSRRNRVK